MYVLNFDAETKTTMYIHVHVSASIYNVHCTCEQMYNVHIYIHAKSIFDIQSVVHDSSPTQSSFSLVYTCIAIYSEEGLYNNSTYIGIKK